MEKRKPTCDLEGFREEFCSVGALRMTRTAQTTAWALGLSLADVVLVVQSMKREHFYKSMTSFADHRIWQDVYHVPSAVGVLYVKFTADALKEFLLLSFKEKDDE